MKVKATLYIQKTVWIEHEVDVDVPAAQSIDDTNEIDDAIRDIYYDWAESQEDYTDARIDYELDDWGWEVLDKQTSED